MSEPSEQVKRRFPWWALLAVGVLIIGAGLAWLFQYRIQDFFQPAETLPPSLSPAANNGDPESEGGTVYETDFSGDLSDWDLFDDGIISAESAGEQLVVEVDSSVDAGGYSGLNYTLDDFVLEVDATKLEGSDNNAMFVVFRLTDGGNYNRFDISSDGWYSVSRVRDGLQTVVSDWMESPAINTGDATNHIRIEAVGDSFQFAVNGEMLPLCVSYEEGMQPIPMDGECIGGEMTETWTNGDLPQGRVGMGVQGFAEFDGVETTPAQATVAFDNVVITEPGTTD